MSTRRVLVTSAMLALLSVPAFAQGMQPTSPAHPAPSAAAPAKPTTTGAATSPVAAKVNLNTATAAELDKVSQIGPARSKAIIEARAKEKFKNWDDFVARKIVPADAAAAMKDVVSFCACRRPTCDYRRELEASWCALSSRARTSASIAARHLHGKSGSDAG
jgi:competence protein ComEA